MTGDALMPAWLVSLFHSYGSDFFRSAVLVVVLLLV
mgnify:FL=1